MLDKLFGRPKPQPTPATPAPLSPETKSMIEAMEHYANKHAPSYPSSPWSEHLRTKMKERAEQLKQVLRVSVHPFEVIELVEKDTAQVIMEDTAIVLHYINGTSKRIDIVASEPHTGASINFMETGDKMLQIHIRGSFTGVPQIPFTRPGHVKHDFISWR